MALTWRCQVVLKWRCQVLTFWKSYVLCSGIHESTYVFLYFNSWRPEVTGRVSQIRTPLLLLLTMINHTRHSAAAIQPLLCCCYNFDLRKSLSFNDPPPAPPPRDCFCYFFFSPAQTACSKLGLLKFSARDSWSRESHAYFMYWMWNCVRRYWNRVSGQK